MLHLGSGGCYREKHNSSADLFRKLQQGEEKDIADVFYF